MTPENTSLGLHSGMMMRRCVPVHQVWSMLWGHLLGGVSFWYSHVYDPTLIVGMYEFVSSPPFPVSGVFLSSSSVHPAHKAGYWDPEQEGNEDDCANNIVLEKLENCTDADVIDEVPNSDNVLVSLFTMPFVTKSLKTWSSVWQNVNRCDSIARTVKVSPAASLTGICTAITHAGLFSLCFTKWNALSLLAFSFLNAVSSIRHVI